MRRVKFGAAAISLTLALTACGGDDAAQPAPPPPPVSSAPTPSPAPSPVLERRKVLFIGGSVTQGAWASSGNSYAERVGRWLGGKFHEVTLKNVAIGGTDSRFGVYRLEQDLAGYVPDIVFVEYSVNDRPDDRRFVYENIDGLIYKLRRLNPDVVIVYIATTYPGELALRKAGSRNNRVAYAQEIVERNGGIFVDAGSHLWHHVIQSGRDPQDFYSDDVHPNDNGHESYFYAISEALNERIVAAKGVGEARSVYFAQSKLGTAGLVDPSKIVTDSTCPTAAGDRLEFVGQGQSYYDLQYQCSSDDTFTARFRGTSIGLTSLAMTDGGQLSCTLDGKKSIQIDLSDSATRIAVAMLFEHEDNGDHTVFCRTSGSAYFGDFLVSEAAAISL